MYCPKCGKENPEDASFCMHCGTDLSEYRVEISPKVEVSPKISVSAKAEGGLSLKWKKELDGFAEVEGYGRLPFYRDFVKLGDEVFCPLCGNYGCVERIAGRGNHLYHCLACNKYFCCDDELPGPWLH